MQKHLRTKNFVQLNYYNSYRIIKEKQSWKNLMELGEQKK